MYWGEFEKRRSYRSGICETVNSMCCMIIKVLMSVITGHPHFELKRGLYQSSNEIEK